MAIAVAIVLLLLSIPVFRAPYYINLKRLMNLLVIGGGIAVILLVALLSPLRNSLIDLTFNKSSSGSYINRLAADGYALVLFIRTHGIGVGFGSNRPSSILTSLLSTVGAPGFILFFGAYFNILSNAKRHSGWLIWAGLALLVNLVSSGPDYDDPWLWCVLALAVRLGNVGAEPLSSSLAAPI